MHPVAQAADGTPAAELDQERADDDTLSGTAVAVFSMCADVGAIVGPLVAGLLADTFSYPVAFAVGAALLLVGAGVSARMPRTSPAAEDHAPAR